MVRLGLSAFRIPTLFDKSAVFSLCFLCGGAWASFSMPGDWGLGYCESRRQHLRLKEFVQHILWWDCTRSCRFSMIEMRYWASRDRHVSVFMSVCWFSHCSSPYLPRPSHIVVDHLFRCHSLVEGDVNLSLATLSRSRWGIWGKMRKTVKRSNHEQCGD